MSTYKENAFSSSVFKVLFILKTLMICWS